MYNWTLPEGATSVPISGTTFDFNYDNEITVTFYDGTSKTYAIVYEYKGILDINVSEKYLISKENNTFTLNYNAVNMYELNKVLLEFNLPIESYSNIETGESINLLNKKAQIEVVFADSTTTTYTIISECNQNDEASITSFMFLGLPVGIQDDIVIDLDTDINISNSIATITISDGASIYPNPNNTLFTAGVQQDFTITNKAKTYSKTYSVTVNLPNPEQGSKVSFEYGQWVLNSQGKHIGIWTVEDLQSINNNLSSDYVLMNDIDLESNSSYRNFSEGDNIEFTPIGTQNHSFKGNFDGNNKSIYNLFINRDDNEDTGLFGNIKNSEIKNLSIVNCNIIGGDYTGGLIGYSKSNSSIINCSVTGNIEGSSGTGGLIGATRSNTSTINCYTIASVSGQYYYTGGLIGISQSSSSVSNSYSSGTVYSYNKYTGGLIGGNYNSKVKNSYSTSDVISTDKHTGGLVGENYNSSIQFCYATGNIKGNDIVGGLVGGNYNYSKIKNSIAYNSSITADSVIGKVTAINTAHLDDNYAKESMNINVSSSSNYEEEGDNGESISSMNNSNSEYMEDWNFDTVWEIMPNSNRPTLKNTGNDNGL